MAQEAAEPLIESSFHTFTVPQILSVIGEIVKIPARAKRNRALLFEALEAQPPETRRAIRLLASQRRGTKRKATASSHVASKRIRAEPTDEMDVEHDPDADLMDGVFLRPATEEVVKDCIARMIDRTGNAAMRKEICMVCARKLFMDLLQETSVENIPNPRRLVPTRRHPAHRLASGGILLHDEALEKATTFICLECHRKLVQDELPPLSLANNMWLGRIPFALEVLTLSERLLIALYYPAAYVVKLYPLKKGAEAWNKKTLNNGMKGNVSTYRLNTAQIVGIAAGNTMPPSPKILAATIGVTFVGVGKVPLKIMPDFLRVRRQRVFEALLWLKANNSLYRNIDISQDQLRLLPIDAVPDEITSNARHSEDVDALEREQAGYVPVDVADREEGPSDLQTVPPDDLDDETYEPAVVPLQAHGVIDVHGDTVPDNDIRAHAFANLAQESVQRDFLIRRGSAFINEYPRVDAAGQRFDGGPGNPNHLLGAFPVLFPYAMGGLEVSREVTVPYEAHVRWALQYADSRFRHDLYFIFQAFGVIQKRQVCRSAGLQIKRSAFIANRVSFLKLTPQDFVHASGEETRKVPFSNPTIRALRKQLTSLRARVSGTDESRISIRAQVWGMNLKFNPPSIWATLNLAETSCPVAQVLAGQEIDLDDFVATAGPARGARSVNIAADPFAAAEFFHISVRAIIEELFGITANRRSKMKRVPGIVGIVNGYIGTVEAQARGTLHLHILFWLQGAPSAAAMKAALESEAFRAKVVAYIGATIRADIKGTTAESVLAIEEKSSVAYSRPVDPRKPNYELLSQQAEATIARVVQVHECHTKTCLRVRDGRRVCKRRAPWQLAPEAWITPSGDWGPRRVFGYLNAWNPPLLQVTRSNQDMKIVTNGQDTKDITFYITMYIAKKQNQSSNASALLAKSMAFQPKKAPADEQCRDINKRMIQQCANTLSRDQELSGSEVVSYLMGWDDRFISHTYSPIYWDEVTAALRTAFPALQKTNVLRRTAEELNLPIPDNAREEAYDPTIRLRQEDGVFVLKDQVKEYVDRGSSLEGMNYYDYHVDTYDGAPLRTTRPGRSAAEASDEAVEQTPNDEEEERRAVGRPASQRVAYLPSAKRKGCRIIRGDSLETLPHFIGSWFPKREVSEYYFANMLALLKPWRRLEDLVHVDGTFKSTFDVFIADASVKIRTIIANINYFHECSEGARLRKSAPLEQLTGTIDLHDGVRHQMELDELQGLQVPLSEADVAAARNEQYANREFLYGMGAMNVAYANGIFDPDDAGLPDGPICRTATLEQTITFTEWGAKIAGMTKRAEIVTTNAIQTPADQACVESGVPATFTAAVFQVQEPEITRTRSEVQQKALDLLNVEQRRAHDIIERHLQRTLANAPQEQLLMIVRGEGGTGKTVLLNAIGHTFDFHLSSDILAKTATTGVAASLVAGVTVHSWAAIPLNSVDSPAWLEKSSPATVERRKRNILPARYVNVDECSMLTKQLLAQLSQVIGQVKASDGLGDVTKPFGGTNLILFGDFHQFPPVGDPAGALYHPTCKRSQSEIGLAIYHQFTTVVTLTEQKRITDAPWKELLHRLRVGACTEADMEMLEGLLLTNARCPVPDWNSPPWDEAVLVTPRHAARVRWNTAAVQKHCRKTGQRMYVCEAEDTYGRDERKLDLPQRVTVAGMPIKKTGKLADRVELAIGMRAMVLINIATEADLANGTRGVITDIVLDSREPSEVEIDSQTGATVLKFPPVVVLFKPDASTFPSFEGLPAGTLPIVPSKMPFNISNGAQGTCRIHRRQLAMTPAYAFTDYKSQGQSLGHVCVDLEKPPTGLLTPFSAYVALSRSSGRESIRLLRGFDRKLFTTHPSPHLDAEDARLDSLNVQTKIMYP